MFLIEISDLSSGSKLPDRFFPTLCFAKSLNKLYLRKRTKSNATTMHHDLLSYLKHSPDALVVIDRFREYLKTEQAKRREFYDLVHEDMKAEFIQGEIILHSPVRMQHLMASSRISRELMNFVDDNDLGFVGIEKMMVTLTRNDYEPDIVFYRKAVSQTFTAEQKLFPAPDLVVEILSKSTRKNDYGIKFTDYAAHQVGEYWIVDAEKATIEQYVLVEGKFELQNKLSKTGILTCIVVNGFRLDVAKVFEDK
jgi:Uma2 family endonuclease